jgi:hypothetical protein
MSYELRTTLLASFALWSMHGGLVSAADEPCEGGWLKVRAQIIAIDPPNKKVTIRRASGSSKDFGIDAMLCEGDKLSLPPGVESVELYEAGRTYKVEKSGHAVQGGATAGISKASEYLKAALSGVSAFSAPAPRPTATAARGGDAAAVSLPIKGILSLRELPRQKLVRDVPVIVGWRDGASPYACEVVDDLGDVIGNTPGVKAGWCEFGKLDGAGRLRVRDANRRSEGWNVALVPWSEVPRPDWIAASATRTLAGGDLAAWGIWLWSQPLPEWRMQAMAMLNAASRREWLAQSFLDHILAETPLVQPR